MAVQSHLLTVWSRTELYILVKVQIKPKCNGVGYSLARHRERNAGSSRRQILCSIVEVEG